MRGETKKLFRRIDFAGGPLEVGEQFFAQATEARKLGEVQYDQFIELDCKLQ